MARSFLRLSYLLDNCLFHENSRKLAITGMKISSNYCKSVSANAEILNDTAKVRKKKNVGSSNYVRHVDGNASAKSMKEDNFGKIKSPNEKITMKLPESFGEMLNKFSDDKDNFYSLDFEGSEKVASDVKEQATDSLLTSNDLFDLSPEDLKIVNETKRKCNVEALNHSLAAYISVCMYSGLYEYAYETFNYYRNLKTEDSEGLNLLPFNEILKGIANQGDLKKMKEVMISLEESSLKPDYNIIAHCLTCLGFNENTPSVIDEIKSTLELMEKNNITLDEIIANVFFPGESLHHFLLAIERVIPDVRDKLQAVNPTKDYILKEIGYNNELVNNLNKSLLTNQVGSPAEGVVPHDKVKGMIQKQIDNELNGYVEIPLLQKKEITSEIENQKILLEEWKVEWRKTLDEALNRYRVFMKKTFSDEELCQYSYFPYFNVLSNEDIIDVLLTEIIVMSKDRRIWSSCNETALYLGHNFYTQFLNRYKENNQSAVRKVYEKYCESILLRSDPDASYVPRVEWNNILAEKNLGMNWNDNLIDWPYTVKLAIGHMLSNFIFENVKIWEYGETPKCGFPAFTKSYGDHSDCFRPTRLLHWGLKSSQFNNYLIRADRMPMLSPPVPWTNLNNGGYVLKKSKFINGSLFETQQIKLIEEVGMQKLYPVMDSLNTLASVPWKVNNNMLDIVTKIFQDGGWAELCICPSPTSFPNLPEISWNMTEQERKEALQYEYQLKKIWKIWTDTAKYFSILNYLKDSVFWTPYQVDFRGRTCPLSVYLNHMVFTDLMRSTICFAQGKKLGEDGLNWLKLHIVNLSGMKKFSSIEDRFKYCEEVMDQIFDSAKNPLDGNKWWTKCNEPWQTLAACKELVAALESGCPEEYISHLPIYQDGSCNVLQHYAALGRDSDGASSVNLLPSETPRDVYSVIANAVEAKREEDERNGVEIARRLKGLVNRRGIKQALLARIYGGSNLSVYRGLLKKEKELNYFPNSVRQEALEYLDKSVSENFTKNFESFHKIKDWLRKISKGVSQHCIQHVQFETPLGFPVLQPYTKDRISAERPKEVIAPYDLDSSMLPNFSKQKRAFPPNFVQSLEASHLILTSLYCQEAGVTFAAVHDSFWTHAATVPIMNKICREQFVNLYSQPIFENFTKFMIEKHSTNPRYKESFNMFKDPISLSLEGLLRDFPQNGDLKLDEVLRSVFFFS